MAIERMKELRQRRHRKKKLAVLARKLKKAKHSETQFIKEKIRRLTPGADVIIENWKLDKEK
jgi:hypothetical protein